ncbi:protein cueball [Chelonus insularis]|uniref:protein cueball n=1 Tax=Chelonus insularis TaxID=460826 RepID=UPI00158B1075|nr:protein cueball [Chelonus insularis]
MSFYSQRILVSFFLFIFLMNLTYSKSWDLAVTIGQEVHFFSHDGTLMRRIKNRYAVSLSGIAYDKISYRLYLSDSRNKNISIFSKNLRSEDSEINVLLNRKQEFWNIVNIIYDPISQSLLWTDSKKKGIFKLDVSSEDKVLKPEVILNLKNENPQGITLDMCDRRLFWTNSNKSRSSISSSTLDGTDYKIIINTDLYDPVALTFDHTTRKIYWIDDDEGIHYKIERSNFDGSHRELLVHGKHQQPFDITIDQSTIYWTDSVYGAIWSINKDIKSDSTPRIWKTFRDSNVDANPTTLITQDNIGPIDCVVFDTQLQKLSSEVTNKSSEQYTFTNNENFYEPITEISQTCFYNELFDIINNKCQCEHSFNDLLCKKSVCHNYCLHGECTILENGRPHCNCDENYQGQHCEQNVCSNYCLNDGDCTLKEGEPHCTCKYSQGVRCEEILNATEVCMNICNSVQSTSNELNLDGCRCEEVHYDKKISYGDNCPETKMFMIIFLTIIGVLLIIITILGYILFITRKKPIIKKRFVVNKNILTPLTSRPSSNNQCEIVIENCCNMNLCETPCFDPALEKFSPKQITRNEKELLLENTDNYHTS